MPAVLSRFTHLHRVTMVCDEIRKKGYRVSQGLVDAHVHLTPGGLALLNLELGGTRSKLAFIAAVREAAGTRRQPRKPLPLHLLLFVCQQSRAIQGMCFLIIS